jgi:hypothetical protein
MKAEQWVLFRYTDENGKVICEKWANAAELLTGDPRLDKKNLEALGYVIRPRISCEVVKRQTEKPTN